MTTKIKKNFWTNFRSLVRANTIGFLITFLMAPLLAWLYPPATFGSLAYFMLALQLLNSISLFRFDWLVPNAKSSRSELVLIACGLISLSLFSTITLFILIFPPSILLKWEGFLALKSFVFLLPAALIGLGLRQLFSSHFIRFGNLESVGRIKLRESVLNVFAASALGMLGFLSSGLIIARTVSSWVGLLHLLNSSSLTLDKFKFLNLSVIVRVCKLKFFNAARATLVSFFNALSLNAPIFILGIHAGLVELGFFLMVNRLISSPIQLGAKALSQSFWSLSASMARSKLYADLLAEYLALLKGIGMPLATS